MLYVIASAALLLFIIVGLYIDISNTDCLCKYHE